MQTSEALVASRDQVLAFRLDSHNLATRLPPGSLLLAAGACGIQNSPPGSAALALHARVADLAPADVDRALAVDQTLLQVWSLRQSPYFFPTSDAAVFTTGLLPEDEESLRFSIRGAGPHLDLVGMSATEAVERTAAALRDVLDGRELTKDDLGIEIAQRVSQYLTPQQLAQWKAPDVFTRYGVTIVRFALGIVALQGLLCFAPRRANAATFLRTDQWLGAPWPDVDPEQARAELVRRYLRCYGPSTTAHFAAWAGIAPAQARRAWQLVEGALVAVEINGRKGWLNEQDVARLRSPPQPAGIRFLPPHDPYLLLRDRETLLPDKTLHPFVWRRAGNPGVILADGQFVATWRPRKKGKRLNVAVELFASASQRMRAQIEVEAATLAPYRGCTSTAVEFTFPP
jgi:hypothetical protein